MKPAPPPTKPRGLCRLGSKHWDAIVPRLIEEGFATDIDTPLLIQLCDAWAIYHKMIGKIRKQPEPNAQDVYALRLMAKAYRDVARLFGQSAFDRSKLDIKPEPGMTKRDKFEAALKKFGGDS